MINMKHLTKIYTLKNESEVNMKFDKKTQEIIKFVRDMQGTGRYKINIWKVKSRDVKIDNRKILALDILR